MSNDLREVAYEIAQLGCPFTRDEDGTEFCFYCSAARRGHWAKDENGITRWLQEEGFDHSSECPWPPFEDEANA